MTVSIIIPVYNVAPYLKACLNSVIAASDRLRAINDKWSAEIICVDDGSTDGSGEILEEFLGHFTPPSQTYALKILHQQNLGVSAARNAGLDVARGDVIAFVDPDDSVEKGWLANLLVGLADTEMVWSGYDQGDEVIEPPDVGALYQGDAVRRRLWRAVFGYRLRDLVNIILPGGLWKRCGREMAGVWRCGVKREVLGDLRFDENLTLYEDAIFLARLAQRVKMMKVVGSCGYHWQIRESGAMTREFRDNLVANKIAVRDARRAIDPKMTQWRGSYWLSFFEIWKHSGFRAALRYFA